MAYDVKFLKGTATAYEGLTQKDSTTFYYVDGKDLYLGEIKLSNASDLADALKRVGTAEQDIDNLEKAVGTLDDLSTTEKSDLVAAINEVLGIAKAATTSGGEVTITTADTPTDGYLKTYVISQYSQTIGKIDIPKDLVVTSGSVVVDPEGQAAGTYIKLVIANQTDPIYINVKDLVDIYTAQKNATQIQLAVSADNEISATIVAGSVGTTELADSAVTSDKIADGNITLAKLSTSVQSSLSSANSAIQKVETGTSNGSIAVDGTDVSVKGLGSAAYAGTDAFDAAGTASDAIKDLDATVSQTASDDNGNIAITVTETDGKLTAVTASISSNTYDASGAAETAESNAKAYTDSALTWSSF
jgi:hypothetical protein